jgi:competence protein ComEA
MHKWGRFVLLATCVASLSHGPAAWGQATSGAEPGAPVKSVAVVTVVPGAKVNLNSADEAALTALKGIGKVKAKAILDYRQNNGPFKTVDELTKVKGIGEKTVANLRDQLAVE